MIECPVHPMERKPCDCGPCICCCTCITDEMKCNCIEE